MAAGAAHRSGETRLLFCTTDVVFDSGGTVPSTPFTHVVVKLEEVESGYQGAPINSMLTALARTAGLKVVVIGTSSAVDEVAELSPGSSLQVVRAD